MNKIKSYYVLPFFIGTMTLMISAIVSLASDGFHWGWAGIVLITVPLMVFLGATVASLFKGARLRVPVCTTLGIAGLVMALYGLFGAGESALTVFLAALGFAGYWLYEFWYARFGRATVAALAPGQPLPDFPLEQHDGSPVMAHSFKGQPTIFLFFRGNWCPLCMTQIREIAGQYQELDRRGAQVVLISPQAHGQTEKLAAKYDVPFHFMVDAGNKAAQQLGIAHPDGLPMGMGLMGYEDDLVMPTVVIADKDGIILFADQTDDYRVRPEPSTFLAVLDGTYAAA